MLTSCPQHQFSCTESHHKLSSHKGTDEHARTSRTAPLHGQDEEQVSSSATLPRGERCLMETAGKKKGKAEGIMTRVFWDTWCHEPWTGCALPQLLPHTQHMCTAAQGATLFWNEPGMQQSPKKYVIKDNKHTPGIIAVSSCSPQLITHIKGRDFNSCWFLTLHLPLFSQRVTKYQLPPPHLRAKVSSACEYLVTAVTKRKS